MARLTMQQIQARLRAAEARAHRARATVARLRRGIESADRRLENQRKSLLGSALIAWCERDERVLAAARRWLAGYVTREVDRACLIGTPFALADAVAAPPADSAKEV